MNGMLYKRQRDSTLSPEIDSLYYFVRILNAPNI